LPKISGERLSYLVGHEEEWAHFEAGVLGRRRSVLYCSFDVDDLFSSGDGLEGNVVVVAVLEDNETAADIFQEEIESEVAVGHGSDGVNGIGIAAADEIAELLVDDVDFLTVVEFSGNVLNFFADDFADAAKLFVTVGVGGFPSKTIFAPSNMAPSETRTME